jgi:hypothetical protein
MFFIEDNSFLKQEHKELQDKLKLNQPFLIKDFIDTSFFGWKDLEQLINFRPLLTDNRFIAVNGGRSEWPYRDWLSDVNTFPVNIIKEQIQTGACYLKDMSRCKKEVNDLVKYFSEQNDCPTDAHIYFSLVVNNNDSFGIHCDESHNFILQIEGETYVKAWTTTIHNGRRIVDEVAADPVVDDTLKPGDLLYVPVWHYHQFISKTKRLSISFPSVSDNKGKKEMFQEREWIEL